MQYNTFSTKSVYEPNPFRFCHQSNEGLTYISISYYLSFATLFTLVNAMELSGVMHLSAAIPGG